MLQCVAVRCNVLQCAEVRCSVLQCAVACCSVCQGCETQACAVVCCSVLQCVAVVLKLRRRRYVLHCLAVYCVLQCVAVCSSVLQSIAVRCSAVQSCLWVSEQQVAPNANNFERM